MLKKSFERISFSQIDILGRIIDAEIDISEFRKAFKKVYSCSNVENLSFDVVSIVVQSVRMLIKNNQQNFNSVQTCC